MWVAKSAFIIAVWVEFETTQNRKTVVFLVSSNFFDNRTLLSYNKKHVIDVHLLLVFASFFFFKSLHSLFI